MLFSAINVFFFEKVLQPLYRTNPTLTRVIEGFVGNSVWYVALLHQTLIAFERFLAIARPSLESNVSVLPSSTDYIFLGIQNQNQNVPLVSLMCMCLCMQIMTPKRVALLLSLCWLVPFAGNTLMLHEKFAWVYLGPDFIYFNTTIPEARTFILVVSSRECAFSQKNTDHRYCRFVTLECKAYWSC